jgi:hypothetical protein
MKEEGMKHKQKHQTDSSFNIERPAPLYPYDKRTDTISLPPEIEEEVKNIALSKGVPLAMKKVMDLTGAGLRVSKDYIDNLLGRNRR